MNTKFELIPHTADIKIRVHGADLAALLRTALYGMFASVEPQGPAFTMQSGRLVSASLPVARLVSVHAPDVAALVVDFLSEALYLSDAHNEVYLDADIHAVSSTQVDATLKGVGITGFAVTEIKAVTYHDLIVRQEPDGSWMAEIVFDI